MHCDVVVALDAKPLPEFFQRIQVVALDHQRPQHLAGLKNSDLGRLSAKITDRVATAFLAHHDRSDVRVSAHPSDDLVEVDHIGFKQLIQPDVFEEIVEWRRR